MRPLPLRPFCLALAFIAILCALSVRLAAPHILREVYQPSFRTVILPSAGTGLRAMAAHLYRDSGYDFSVQLAPNQGGTLWIGLVALVALGAPAGRWSDARRLDLLLAQAVGWALFGVLDIFRITDQPEFFAWVRFVFTVVAATTAALWARTFWLQWRPYPARWRPPASARTAAAVAGVLVTANLVTTFIHQPDDSSYFANLGGARLLERGRLPYGDPLLTGTPGAAYPPLLYLVHAGAQVLVGSPVNQPAEDRPRLGDDSHYPVPYEAATKLVVAGSHVLGLAALWVIGSQLRGPVLGWSLVGLYAASSGVLGAGGTTDTVTGLSFVSHIVPAAVSLLAFAWLDRPVLAGAGLGAAMGTGFYPVFFLPIWAAWLARRTGQAAIRFLAGVAAVAVPTGIWVLAASDPAAPLGLVGTIVRDTLGHHSAPRGYGRSLFGLWGQSSGLLGWLSQPLVASVPAVTPFFLVFIASLAVATWCARRATRAQLALLTAGAAMGANLWKVHATATYIAWYYPFLLIGLLASGPEGVATPKGETPP